MESVSSTQRFPNPLSILLLFSHSQCKNLSLFIHIYIYSISLFLPLSLTHTAYGYFSPLWRVALKLWHSYRLALRWARFARALRLSVALFQTERKRGGLTYPSLTHTLIVSYALLKHTHTNGDNEMSLHTESKYLSQAALQSWQVSGEC